MSDLETRVAVLETEVKHIQDTTDSLKKSVADLHAKVVEIHEHVVRDTISIEESADMLKHVNDGLVSLEKIVVGQMTRIKVLWAVISALGSGLVLLVGEYVIRKVFGA